MSLRLLLRESKGQAMVELVLIMPVLLLILFGILEFGRIFSTELILANTAREAARKAVVGASDAATILYAEDSAPMLDSSKMILTIVPDEFSRIRGNSVTVNVSYPVKIYAPVISTLIGDPYTVTSQATMRVE